MPEWPSGYGARLLQIKNTKISFPHGFPSSNLGSGVLFLCDGFFNWITLVNE